MAEVTCELLSLVNSRGIAARAERTGVSCVGAGTVSHLESGEVPSLDGACGALTFACTYNVNVIADSENVSLEDIAHVEARLVVKSELSEGLLGGDARLVEVTLLGLVDSLYLDVAEAELNSLVAVVLNSLLHNDRAGACLDDCYGNNLSVCIEDLSHADLLSDECFLHSSFLLL